MATNNNIRRNSENPFQSPVIGEGREREPRLSECSDIARDTVHEEEEQLSSSSVSGGDLLPVPPPDGGWGWVVVFASFMLHIIGKNTAETMLTSDMKASPSKTYFLHGCMLFKVK